MDESRLQTIETKLTQLAQLENLSFIREKIMLQQITDLQTAVAALTTEVTALGVKVAAAPILSADDKAALTQIGTDVATAAAALTTLGNAIPAA